MSTPLEQIGAAERVLDGTVVLPAPVALRAAALLARAALEDLVTTRYVLRTGKPTRMRTQLIVLRRLAGSPFADRAEHAWSALSRLCHHHAYRLDPDRAEVAGWVVEVRALAEEAAPSPP
ncbi:hypothetical protein [Actinosynnema pretiosum]|uniref:Uncharacterized protein n=1 Tax=Actinosynnema pretiosum TaxID=42197 RepID=A0A290ZDG0_9PSEU|nr:hypothetical protein [Actinosynnema pretiosum]ATE57061.1 hypothetical protein CNX65_30360 [Actinosynnema pretiosum]